jgi:hypothetical protein
MFKIDKIVNKKIKDIQENHSIDSQDKAYKKWIRNINNRSNNNHISS